MTDAPRRSHVFLKWVTFASLMQPNVSLLITPSSPLVRHIMPSLLDKSVSSISVFEGNNCRPIPTSTLLRMAPSSSDEIVTINDDDANYSNRKNMFALTYRIAAIASILAWIATATIALSYHPDPRFMDCTMRHNILTMSQAYAFPLPVMWSCFDVLRSAAKKGMMDSDTARRIGLAVCVASFWLAASVAFAPQFAFGYDLYGFSHKVAATTVWSSTGLLALGGLLQSTTPVQLFRGLIASFWKLGLGKSTSDKTSVTKNSSLFATGCIGLLWFTILPIVSPYPLATVPTILGKRLSRPASAFTFLGSIMAYCLKEGADSPNTSNIASSIHKTKKRKDFGRILRRGLAIGSGSHLLLIALKIIGLDGGGLILPGRGLWEVYPAMISVPFATGSSLLIHAVVCFAACSKRLDSILARWGNRQQL